MFFVFLSLSASLEKKKVRLHSKLFERIEDSSIAKRKKKMSSSSTSNVDVAAGVTAALVCAGVGFLAEFLLAAWAYRKPGFRSLRVRLG